MSGTSKLALELIEKEKRERTGSLDLGNCGLTEIPEEVAELVWLETLSFSAVQRFKGRSWIGCSNQGKENKISTLPIWLGYLKLLKCLKIGAAHQKSHPLRDISIISKMTHLIVLDISYTNVVSLEPISYLTNIKELDCSGTKVTTLEFIDSLLNLEKLYCFHTNINTLKPIEYLFKLEKIDCSSTKINTLQPVSCLSNMKKFYCFNNKIDTLEPIALLSKLEILDCHNTQINTLNPICSLSNLKEINCSRTLLCTLEPVSSLSNLTTLNCAGTNINSLKSTELLTNLETLSCSNTKIDSLKAIASLSNLRALYCNHTQIHTLEPISFLSKLGKISCAHTQVKTLEPIASLYNLQTLNCSNTQIKNLEPLTSLSNLQTLYCSNTQIKTLEPLTSLSNLQRLYCSNTQIKTLEPLTCLSNLQTLSCSDTQINTLAPISSLSNLDRLECGNSKIFDIRSLKNMFKGQIKFYRKRQIPPKKHVFYADNCPFVIPPIEFAKKGHEAVMEYFEQIEENAQDLNEVKIIFLGEGASGKTSLIKRLRQQAFDPDESQTHGIRIRKTHFDSDGEQLAAHLWDFGGQEVMHATHQFFLSQRCIYVLVLNSRSDDKAEYWLKHASSFGGRSPVLVVLNKIDENPSFEVNRKGLSEKYPTIRSYHRLSCLNQQGIDDFKNALIDTIKQADTRRTPFPAAWLAVKEHFSEMQKDYIESEEYQQVCLDKGVDRPFSQEVLLQFLHDLGVIINFRTLKTFDTQILNPLWLTNGVYRIINSEKVTHNKGLLHENDFDTVINDSRYVEGNTTEKNYHYPRNKLLYIVRVMQEFELCFALDTQRYIVPQLLPVEEVAFNFSGAKLHFEIHFPEFLPDSIFPRLMVKLHSFIKGDLRWRSGMILEVNSFAEAIARIRADKEDKIIRIDVCGKEPRRFLSYIRETLKEIISDFANLDYEERVPVADSKEIFEYAYLAEMEKEGEENIYVRGKGRVSVSDLLNGVEEPDMRDEAEQLPVKAFISYAHKDAEHLQALRAALSPLERLKKLQIWDDRAIDAGSDWEKEIFRQLEEADIVLCLVSHDFINSDFCFQREFETALAAHHQGEKSIVPIQLRSCFWDDLELAKIQGTPGKWILSQRDQDDAWTTVAKSLQPAITQAKQRLKIDYEREFKHR